MTFSPPNAPKPEYFGLTEERINYFNEIENSFGSNFVALIIIINIIILIAIFVVSMPDSKKIHPIILLIFGIGPGLLIGEKLSKFFTEIELNKLMKINDYHNYLNYINSVAEYKKAIIEYNNALKSHDDLQRKIRYDDIKKSRNQEILNKRAAEWWHGIDGRRFELEVAKILMSKNYNVKHTGSPFGDKGIDMVLSINDRKIIVQCKAFKSYVSAGIVRELYGTLIHENADEAWLIVTQGFYKGAKDFAHNKPIRLMTIRDLIEMPPII